MKKIIICLLIVFGTLQFGCKKFLNITPIDSLTGNNFYQTVEDIESNIIDMYGTLFQKYTNTNTAGATGEFRSGEVIPAEHGNSWRFNIAALGGHNRRAPNPRGSQGRMSIPASTVFNDRTLNDVMFDNFSNIDDYEFYRLTNWNDYYRVIQSANLLISKLEEGIPALSSDQTKRYIAEGKFIRNYCYFTLVRLYGNVVYYTNAYQKDALPRENMVTVIRKCIDDLKAVKDNVPWNLSDPTQKGVRASRGSIVGLLMNMNMWNAGFDPANKQAYYNETIVLGREITGSNAFQLLPLSEWNTVSRGRSEESLFELFSTLNYGSNGAIRYAPFGETFIHFPYRLPEYDFRFSAAIFTEEYMRKLYPVESEPRLLAWFDAPYDNNTETFQMKKFAGNTPIDSSDPNNPANPDNSYLIIRYADAILLLAEALAEVDEASTEAIAMLNKVRERAGADSYPNGAAMDNDGLRDAIFWERAKELMGEGTHYFDLVRTRRVLNRKYTDNPLTPDKFNRGAWAWPINSSALINNRFMELNNYWIGDGF